MSRARWGVMVALLVLVAVLAVSTGTISLSLAQVWNALRGTGDSMPMLVVRTLRLPRVALAALVGGSLGMSGAALQGTMRNPLAEPYLLGVSGVAAVGAVAATSLGLAPTLL